MSSTESSGAPAEATATTPAPEAAFPSFGSTRGSGLARGKRPAAAPAATAAASSDYKPTAIEVVSAPREYQNPFAPVETPAVVAPEPVVAAPAAPEPAYVAPAAPVVAAPDNYVAPSSAEVAPAPAPVAEAHNEEPAGLNILEPMKPKTVPAQTWESEGFRPAREQRQERPRREEPRREERADAPAAEPVDISTIPAKFLYVRPGYNYVPTPSNYGGAPRERAPRGENAPATASAPRSEAPKRPVASSHAPASEKPASGGGFFGWLKSLFGSAPETPATAPQARASEPRTGGQRPQGQQREGGQGRGDGQRRRHRGGRGRGQGGGHHRSEGSQQGGV